MCRALWCNKWKKTIICKGAGRTEKHSEIKGFWFEYQNKCKQMTDQAFFWSAPCIVE